MSKQRAIRRAEREEAARKAAAKRERDRARRRRMDAARSRLMAPAHETSSRWQRFATWFRKQSTGRKVLLVVWAVVVVLLMVRAETWGTRFMVLGFSCLLLPVAWTLVPGRRR